MEYEWGSRTGIPRLLGLKEPSDHPMAELWMGAHPKAPSQVKDGGRWVCLMDAIEKNPEDILGRQTAEIHSNRLPFLFKILAVEKPLSIQVHPGKSEACHGFKRESEQGVPIEAPQRSYRDKNHKSEIICAISRFSMMAGFRSLDDIRRNVRRYCPESLKKQWGLFQSHLAPLGLKRFYHSVMTLSPDAGDRVIHEALSRAGVETDQGDETGAWMARLHKSYPRDMGVIAPLFFNLFSLEPGQAAYIPWGTPHCYLMGLGAELMSNSDNVIRGGLTSKPMDIPEFLRVMDWEKIGGRKIKLVSEIKMAGGTDPETDPETGAETGAGHLSGPKIIRPKKIGDGERVYPTDSKEFRLSFIDGSQTETRTVSSSQSVEILFCVDGRAAIRETDSGRITRLGQGESVIVPGCVERYSIEGAAKIYKASVPAFMS